MIVMLRESELLKAVNDRSAEAILREREGLMIEIPWKGGVTWHVPHSLEGGQLYFKAEPPLNIFCP